MRKKILFPFVLSSLVMFSSAASACAYCYGYHDSNRSSNYSESYSKLARDFENKRYELNKLYDEGISETDERAKGLIKDLDSLSSQMQTERESVRPNNNNRSHRRNYGHCW